MKQLETLFSPTFRLGSFESVSSALLFLGMVGLIVRRRK
ncbi:PEP-CTERM sorting domain-containing protein [Microvenator marinus]|uniref:PEP-CTERM sorting domain-containing protein n=1 Tax=Microvenator marinus TaxID=2600177 RepID=A0A5B8XUW1_9DELT|nr:PEP-CTERM sorting domain-containing protein [Microvenator marinus]